MKNLFEKFVNQYVKREVSIAVKSEDFDTAFDLYDDSDLAKIDVKVYRCKIGDGTTLKMLKFNATRNQYRTLIKEFIDKKIEVRILLKDCFGGEYLKKLTEEV